MHIILEEALMNPKEVMNSLMYASYVANRKHSPLRTSEEWKVIYGDKVGEYEALYQSELKIKDSQI
jgi:hypothetical protein